MTNQSKSDPSGDKAERKRIYKELMDDDGPYKYGPPDGVYPRELLEKLVTSQLRNIAEKHELELRPKMSEEDVIELLLDPESIRLIREKGARVRRSTRGRLDSGSAALIEKHGCLKPFLLVWLLGFCGLCYFFLFTDAGKRELEASSQREAAKVAAKTIDNKEMNAFCNKVRGFKRRHYMARNRIKQGQVFKEFQKWFKASQQAESSLFSNIRARVMKIEADKSASTAGISFDFCRLESNRSVEFFMWQNGIGEHQSLYNRIADLGYGSEVLLSGTLRYKGFKTPSLTGTYSNTWTGKASDKFWGYVFDVDDSEDDEEDVLEDFWFEVKLDSIERPTKEVEKEDKKPEPKANNVEVADGTVPALLRGRFKMVSGDFCSKKRTQVELTKRKVSFKSRKAKSDCTRAFEVTGTELNGSNYTLKVDGEDDFVVSITPKGIAISAAPSAKLKGQFKGKRKKK